jgi:hypothetical protein
MATQCQALCGRTGDTVLVTTDQIRTWFNEAQRDIADRVPGLHALIFSNKTSLDVTDTLRYALADITAGDTTEQEIANVWNVFYLDGEDSRRLTFVHTDEFDKNWIDPTHADAPRYRPRWWTRRGHAIEIAPMSGCGYWDHDLRFDGDVYPREFSAADTTRASDLSGAEEGLVSYALAQAWRAIGSAGGVQGALLKAADYSRRYESWLDTYEHKNNRLDEWNGNLYDDDIPG